MGWRYLDEDKGWYRPGDGARRDHYFVIDTRRSNIEQFSLCNRWQQDFPGKSPQNTTHPDDMDEATFLRTCGTCRVKFYNAYGRRKHEGPTPS